MRHLILCLFIWLIGCTHYCSAESTYQMVLKGFLGKEELKEARQTLEKTQNDRDSSLLVLEINSSSGDLNQVLDLAKAIYELKVLKHLRVIAYINDNAIGPAAALPFVSDELYCSLFVSWGDIPLGSEGSVPTNILRNRVESLIDNRHPKAALLHVLAEAMSDSQVQVVDENGWKAVREAKGTGRSLISAPGQTLVINQNQLKELGLVADILTPEAFYARLGIKPAEKPVQEESAVLVSHNQNPEDRFKQWIHYQPEGPNQIGYIYIGDHESSISQSTWLYVKKALEYYKKNPPIFIILELNTPGGEVFPAQKISDELKQIDTQFHIPVVTVINNWAVSAGAMLTYSTRFITSVKDGIMGAAEPVYMGESGKLETASEKVNSALRSDFASRARFFDRNPYIAEAMVDKDVILVLRHGRIIKLDQESQIRLTGSDPDKVISPKGKLLTLDADQMLAYGLADVILQPKVLPAITSEEQAQGKWSFEKNLLSQVPFFAHIPKATIDRYQMDWKTQFFVLLATPLVSSLLFMGLIIGAYMELNNPGLSLPGSIAAICLFLIILSSFSLEIANWLELILLLTGLILVLVELFVLPTFGLLGFVGILLFIVGLFGMMLPGLSSVGFEYDTHQLNVAGKFFLERLAWLSGALILSMMIIAALARYLTPNFAGFKRFVLSGHEQEGYVAGYDAHHLPKPGAVGAAFSTLRPAGKILIEDQIYDAISEREFIESGERVIVERIEGGTVVVNRRREANT